MARRLTFLLAVCLSVGLFAHGRGVSAVSTQASAQQAGRAIGDRTANMQKLDGFIPMYWEERTGSLFLEISRFDTEFLLTTGLAAGLGSNDIGLDRGQQGGERIVSFQRVGPKVLLVESNEIGRAHV